MTTYRIEHRTTYTYDSDVTGSYGLIHLRPRDLSWQTCVAHEVGIEPEPADLGPKPLSSDPETAGRGASLVAEVAQATRDRRRLHRTEDLPEGTSTVVDRPIRGLYDLDRCVGDRGRSSTR